MHENDTSFFNVESPAAGASLAPGWQPLRGWLVPKPGFHFVDVRARLGSRVFPGVYGYPRADLAAHFAPTRPWLPAEYTVEVELPEGPSEVALEALSFAGEWRFVQTLSCHAQGDHQPRAARDPLGAEEVALATELLLKNNGRQSAEEIAASIPYPPVLRPNHPPFHGFIDEPSAISPALYGRLHVLGWLFHETLEIKRVFVSTDLLIFHPVERGGEFPGVKERFPNQPKARNCRLFGFADVSSQLPAATSARFFAELEDGTTHLVLAVQSRGVTTSELNEPFPEFSTANFWSKSRALRNALDAKKVPYEAGKKLLTHLGKSFFRYRREAPQPHDDQRSVAGAKASASAASKPRLLLVTHNLNFEGAPLLFLEYARSLAKNNRAELMVVSGQDGPLRAGFAEIGADVVIADLPPLFAAKSRRDFSQKVAELATRAGWQNIQAVIANTLFSFWGIELAGALNCPSLLYIHESTNPIGFFKERISPKLLPAVGDALGYATAVSFNTEATAAYYRPYAPGNNFRLTSAWIDLAKIDAFRAAHPRTAMRAKLQVKPDEYFVANVGTVCDRKGQHDFLRAIEWLWRLKPAIAARCRFAMIGGRDTPYNRFLHESLANLGRGNVEIVAETDAAYDYFAAADLFVCTSYEESFPRVVLEAMAFEVPIVSTDVHGIPFMLRADEDALLLPPGDAHALARAILRTLEDPIATKARATHARQRVLEFDASVVLPQHVKLTNEVIGAAT